MQHDLKIYNTLSRKTELFTPIHSPYVGMYVCGPTVYSDVHLGNVRTFLTFDVIYRYLQYKGYKVRYVRNITDAGHLESDADEGEDKISKKARLEKLEPMEIVQRYSTDFREVMRAFNILPPSIEPTATGHICEQIEMVKSIMDQGYAYESQGSIYFDVEKYSREHSYGKLSNRNLEDLQNNTRELDGQDEKRGKLDFALWIKAKPGHIMRWPSPWGEGFPGWHLECSAMSSKYLGSRFDIHGGGMDLIPTHHTNEIAQNVACCGTEPANYWIHTNMLTVNGQKMSKSLGNSFLPHELFSGSHKLLERGYSPMVVRFFMLQAHYRSTLDFSNEALQAAEKGWQRLSNALELLDKLKAGASSKTDIKKIISECIEAMDNDFNTPIAISQLFELAGFINNVNDGRESIDEAQLNELKTFMNSFMKDVLGLELETVAAADKLDGLMQIILKQRAEAKARKDYASSDAIRDQLLELGFVIKDSKEGTTYSLN